MKRPFVIAHRGNSRHFPENTGPAFGSIGASVDGIETDIQLSRDGVPVLYHDSTLKKLTGRKDKVHSQTLKSLRKLDFGGWFGRDFEGTDILTLDKFLSGFGHGKKILLEIKARDDDPAPVIQELTEKVVSEVIRKGILERVNILSFSSEVLRRVHSLCESVTCMQIFEKRLPAIETSLRESPWLSGYVVALSLLSEVFVESAHRVGKVVAAFTCNTEQELSHSLDLRVDYIISDNPDGTGEWLNSRCF